MYQSYLQRKHRQKNIAGDVYTTKVESFTHGRVYDIIVSKEFLGEGDHVLLIDDFLLTVKALEGLAKLVKDSGAELVGAGVVIEKRIPVRRRFLKKTDTLRISCDRRCYGRENRRNHIP